MLIYKEGVYLVYLLLSIEITILKRATSVEMQTRKSVEAEGSSRTDAENWDSFHHLVLRAACNQHWDQLDIFIAMTQAFNGIYGIS